MRFRPLRRAHQQPDQKYAGNKRHRWMSPPPAHQPAAARPRSPAPAPAPAKWPEIACRPAPPANQSRPQSSPPHRSDCSNRRHKANAVCAESFGATEQVCGQRETQPAATEYSSDAVPGKAARSGDWLCAVRPSFTRDAPSIASTNVNPTEATAASAREMSAFRCLVDPHQQSRRRRRTKARSSADA